MVALVEILRDIEEAIRSKQYTFPDKLLRKMDPANEFDAENLSYIYGVGGFYYQWLALLVCHLRPHCFLELGSRYGMSTMMIYSELPVDSRLITVDLIRDQRYVPDEMFNDPGVSFVYGDACDLAIYKGAIPLDINVLYTDTVHTYEQVKSEYDIYEPLLANEALIIVDDLKWNDKGRFFEEWPDEQYDLTELCHGSGFGVMVYRRIAAVEREQRILQAALASAQVGKSRHFVAKAEVDWLKARSFQVRFLQPIYRHLPAALYGPILTVLRRRKEYG